MSMKYIIRMATVAQAGENLSILYLTKHMHMKRNITWHRHEQDRI